MDVVECKSEVNIFAGCGMQSDSLVEKTQYELHTWLG